MFFYKDRFHWSNSVCESLHKLLTINMAVVGAMAFLTTEILAQGIPATITVNPKVTTASVDDDADDPAVWIHPADPAKSVIIGTDKGDNGGLYVWDMEGGQLQYIELGNPNNVDVRYGMLGSGKK